MKLRDLSGRVFDRLRVLGLAHITRGQSFWECQCVCNRLRVVLRSNLVTRSTKSCGQCGHRGRSWSDQALQELAEWQDLKARNWSLRAIARLYGTTTPRICQRFRRFQQRLARECQVWCGGFTTPGLESWADQYERRQA
jgi:hypothetical protein